MSREGFMFGIQQSLWHTSIQLTAVLEIEMSQLALYAKKKKIPIYFLTLNQKPGVTKPFEGKKITFLFFVDFTDTLSDIKNVHSNSTQVSATLQLHSQVHFSNKTYSPKI